MSIIKITKFYIDAEFKAKKKLYFKQVKNEVWDIVDEMCKQ